MKAVVQDDLEGRRGGSDASNDKPPEIMSAKVGFLCESWCNGAIKLKAYSSNFKQFRDAGGLFSFFITSTTN